MVSSKLTAASIVFFGLLFVCGTFGHSYLTSPISRGNQRQTQTGCRGPACLGPCERKVAQINRAPIPARRGDVISLQWPRNNHAGGFIRVAWAPTAQSDSHTAFDNNVQTIFCHEVGGCKPDNPNDPNGGDSNPADGSFLPCTKTITIPPHLTDGKWTLQWAWFGGAFALGDYYSCADYEISGGNSGSAPAAFFEGGDYSNRGQQVCKYFNVDRLHRCVNEPCDNPVFPSGQRTGTAFGLPVGNSNGNTGNNQPSTTGSPAPVTTGRVAQNTPVTTGRAAQNTPVTTGQVAQNTPSTTGAAANPDPTPNGNGANCAGASAVSSSTATILSVDAWGTTYRMVVQLTVRESRLPTWSMQFIPPSSMGSTTVQNTFNAGVLQCQATSPIRHAMIKPSASWGQNLVSGTTLTIEIMGTNPNRMSADQIKANTQLVVFAQ